MQITVKPIAGRRYYVQKYKSTQSERTTYYRTSYGPDVAIEIGRQFTWDGDYYGLNVKNAYTVGAWLTFDPNDFEVLGPVSAQTGTAAVTIVLGSVANLTLKCGVMESTMPDNNQSGYNALFGISTDYTINTGEQSVTLELDNSEIQKLKLYGIGIIPTSEASPKTLNASIMETITPNKQIAVLSLSNYASPGQVIPISPSNHSIIVAGEDVTVTYRYTQISGAAMGYLGVRYTDISTGTVTTLLKKSIVNVLSGSTGTFTIPADTLGAGLYKFEYSGMPSAAASYYADSSDKWLTGTEAEYTVVANPSTSAITCDGKPVPTVSWTSTSQAAFQVRFGDYDSGARAGDDTSFTVPRIFADGNYPVQVRTATDAGEWSGWTEIEYVAISNGVSDPVFYVTAERFGDNIKLSWTYSTNTETNPDRYAIFRDDKMIGITENREFVDRYAVAGTYTVYTMVFDEYYLKSYPISVSFPPKYDVISANDGLTYTRLKYTPDMKSQPESHQTEVSFAWFAGRRKPVAMTSNQKTRVKQFSYIFHSRADAEFLIDLEGREALLKNTRGAVIYGILSGLTISDERCPVVSFSIQEIEREGENVEYHV